MGFFSGETVYTVDTSTSRVIEDAMLPDSTLQSLIRGILQDSNLADSITGGYLNSMAHKAERLARRVGERYPEGLLKTTVLGNRGNQEAIRQAVEQDVGQTVTLEYAVLGPLNYTHATWQRLTEEYGYDEDRNVLEALSPGPDQQAFLLDFVIELPAPKFERATQTGGTTGFDRSPQSGYVPGDRPAQQFSIRDYVWNSPTVAEGAVTLPTVTVRYLVQAPPPAEGESREAPTEHSLVLEFDLEGDGDLEFYQAKYRTGIEVGYWSYRLKEGRHPALDNVDQVSYVSPGEVMPVIYFIKEYRDATQPPYRDTPSYAAAADLLDLLGLDYDDVAASIQENPDIDKVRTAFLMFGVPADAEDPLACRYLFDFFEDFHDRAALVAEGMDGFPENDWLHRARQYPGLRNYPIWHMAPVNVPGDQPFGAQMSLSCYEMTARLVPGQLPAGQSHSLEQTTRTVEVKYRKQTMFKDGGEWEISTREMEMPALVLKKRISDAVYKEVVVVNPYLRHHIDGSGRGTNNTLGDPDFLVPLDRRFMANWNRRDREHLYAKSLHFVFNARDKQHLEWYETGFFKFVITAIAIVITFYFQMPVLAKAAAALATATVTAIAWTVVTAIVKMAVFNMAFDWVVEQIGPELAFLAALAAALYGGFKGFQYGSVQNAPWATELLQVSTGLSRAVGDYYRGALAELRSDAAALAQERSEAWDALDEANALLSTGNLLDPFAFVGVQPAFVPGESPENFYQRTVHSGNIGTRAIDAIHHHVDVSLRLPTFADTAQGYLYG